MSLNKRGSVYIEASIVLPVSCLILFALAALIMIFHGDVAQQVSKHTKDISAWDCEKEIETIRKYERFIDWI